MRSRQEIQEVQNEFIRNLLVLKEIIESNDIESLKLYQKELFERIIRPESSNFNVYAKSLISQIFSEIKHSLVKSLEEIKRATKQSLSLTGLRVNQRQNSIKFFCANQSQEILDVPGKYGLLIINNVTDDRSFFIADYDGEKSFQINYKTDPSIIELFPLEDSYNVFFLVNLTPYLREFAAAKQPVTPILKAIAEGAINAYYPPENTQITLVENMNHSQSRVFNAFISLTAGIQLLKGPPGTGKSTSIVSILFSLCETLKLYEHGPILVCGPSNKSVAVIAQSFQKKFPKIPIVFFDRENTANKIIRSVAEQEICKAYIIFATLSKVGSSLLLRSIDKIHALIVDESGQASEQDILIPLQLNPNKVLLVGDESQLPPTVLCDNPEAHHYHWSILERLINQCHQPHFLLDRQYRMHPEISHFPREAFYDNLVQDGVTSEQRSPVGELTPYEVIDVQDSIEKLDPVLKSYFNVREATATVQLIIQVLAKGYLPKDISVITPYKAQVLLLQQLLHEKRKLNDIAINTIDSFQGEEGPVVFVSMVRANAQARIGFAKDFRRLNVAITRPQQVLRILMNGVTFNPLHPKNELQSSLQEIFSTFKTIPLPGQDYNLSMYDPENYDDEGEYNGYGITHYSENGYRRELSNYFQKYKVHGVINSEVIVDDIFINNLCDEIHTTFETGNDKTWTIQLSEWMWYTMRPPFNGIFLFKKNEDLHALIIHSTSQYETIKLCGINEMKIDFREGDDSETSFIRKISFSYFGQSIEDMIISQCHHFLFDGPKPLYRLLRLLRHAGNNFPGTIGKLPIFFLSTLPQRTHIIQEILNRVKEWRGLSFVGLPEDTFNSFQYSTFTRMRDRDEIEDHGYLFDESDNYLECGYSSFYTDWEEYDDDEVQEQDLVFEDHVFYRCNLKGINFHNSKFTNTKFIGCNVDNCQINIGNMDIVSKESFEECQKKSQAAQDHLPTDKLVLDAIRRGVYSLYQKKPIDTPNVLNKNVNNIEKEPSSVDANKNKLLQPAQQHVEIGPRFIEGWRLQDVEDKGNCFYNAIVEQMKTMNHPFLDTIATETLPQDSLRLRIQKENFKDQEWADVQEILQTVREFNIVIAIVDTRHPELNFRCYYLTSNNEAGETYDHAQLPENIPMMRLAYTGNHYLSVQSHPSLNTGAIRRGFTDPRLVICHFVETFWKKASRAQLTQHPINQKVSPLL